MSKKLDGLYETLSSLNSWHIALTEALVDYKGDEICAVTLRATIKDVEERMVVLDEDISDTTLTGEE
jgi:hypothetical protein